MSKYISCMATSVQLGSKRFPDSHERPQIKAWRCDLTALSRSHNLYFVACNDTIHVYQPKFPDQSIRGEPELLLHPPTSSPFLQPGIDYEDSHSITRLHVDYLGQDEIILITCDDGDVIGYRTEEIQRVLDKRTEISDDESDFQIEETVRTFLHRNVGASAWGLAIHREARMIAISANTHKITVIAYALAQPNKTPDGSSVDSSDSELEDCSGEEDPADFPSPRRQDHVITLSARHNIPSVSFNDSGDDPSGRWLSSCSINGETLLWDLYNPAKPVRTIQLGFCASVKDPTKAPKLSPGSCACLRPSNFPHAIWSTMFLQASTAYEDPSLQDSTLPSDHPLPYIEDVSGCKNRFSVKPRKTPPAVIALPNDGLSGVGSSEMDVSGTESVASDDSESQPSSPQPTGIEQSQQSNEAEAAPDALTGESDADQLPQEPIQSLENTLGAPADDGGTSHNTPAPFSPPPQIPSTVINTLGVWFQPPNQSTATIVWDDDGSGTDDELFIPSTAQAHMAFANAIRPTRAYCEVTTAFTLARQSQITSPLLIVTKEDIYLYQRPLDYVGDHSDPIVTIRRPLHPSEREKPFPFIPGSHDRHCYTTHIPELGVFIIASPNGRAGIFALTRTNSKNQARPLYSFHLEYVLPFVNDDENKVWDVEGARLIGVAAGPVQCMLDRSDELNDDDEDVVREDTKLGTRRWRVMMYFTDHTVLAFELGKRRVSETPEVGELVV
ncbi:hypothetical protein BU25DRAFT_411100 [Macroventuria anomochaeta]|uniref:Uncharacterized protein n=1 Tax=Macroventuria anomochaeta TaxID=301207 RepID=A0ACB6RYK8_9PLEO|nr:uncharacterized protein BU25DRAFT_411100 [Macroventuria anomochaeta]KAF2626996.1 hypothetical protein BU25DRAFT_411100 [Macroventuria anomochaeta]